MAGLFRLAQTKWNPPAKPTTSFKDQTVLVTGSNIGLGFEAASWFASLGAARLILAVRNEEKGEKAKREIEARLKKSGANADCIIEVWQLDMSSYESIQEFAKRVDATITRLDIAVLNAGIWQAKFQKSKYGYEQTIQVNTLSTVLLGLLLLPKLSMSKKADGGRTPVLEFVSSGTHFGAKLNEKEQSGEVNLLEHFSKEEAFSNQKIYAISKFMLMCALASLVETRPADSEVTISSVCPGFCTSSLSRDLSGPIWGTARQVGWLLFARTTEEGSRTLVTGTTLGEKGHGGFWQHDTIRDPARLLTGEVGARLKKEVWKEIIEALRKDVPDAIANAGL